MSRTKVLFLIPSLAAGGAERVFSILLRHLDRNRFEPYLALLQPGGELAQDIPPDVVVYNLKALRVRYALPALVKLVWRIRPAALLSTLGHLNLALIAVKPLLPAATRVVVRESSVASVLLRDGIPHPRLWGWLYRRLYNRADKVICPSDTVMEDLIANFHVPREKLVRIYNPVDANGVRAHAESEGNPHSGPGPQLVTAGRLSTEKGLDVLLHAMPTILRAFPHSRLTILGEGPQMTDLAGLSNELNLANCVAFMGFQRNPWRYMRYADVFVLPSRFEGLPNVLLEALALGVRIVATDCPGGTREIQVCNSQMVFVPPENADALAQAIIQFCNLPKPAQEMESIQQNMSAFDPHMVVNAYSQILEQV